MTSYPSDVAFTSSVKSIQSQKGSRAAWAKVEQGRGWQTEVTPELTEFLGNLDMFYIATASAEGQPYLQYRGGAPGFLKVVDAKTLGFADFSGNRQYITLGNLAENPRAFIFLMDYENRRRIKLWGTARVVEDEPELMQQLQDDDYSGKPERAILFSLEAWDVNCPQHIHRRFSENRIAPVIDQLQTRIQELETRLASRQSSAVSVSGSAE